MQSPHRWTGEPQFGTFLFLGLDLIFFKYSLLKGITRVRILRQWVDMVIRLFTALKNMQKKVLKQQE